MPSDEFLLRVFVALGMWGVIGFLAIAIFWKFIHQWLSGKIAAGVDRELREKLATHQHDLDRQLEMHRAHLAVEREQLRSSLDKSITDYRIYAERRADAIMGLFASFLAAELKAMDRSMFSLPDSQEISAQALEELLQQLRVLPPQAALIRDAYEHRRGTDTLIHDAAKALKYRLVMEARDEAHEAYYRAVLYLPPAIDQAALAVRDYFHMIAVDHAVPSGRGPEYVQHNTRLRFLMLQLQNAAQAELSSSTRELPSPAQPAIATPKVDSAGSLTRS